MKKSILFLCIIPSIFGCHPKADLTKAKQEIRDAETAFEKTSQEKGIAEAFYEFADKEATINRGKLVHGRDAIREFYLNAKMETSQLNWSPDSIFVSQSADMGYTYGKYKLVEMDSAGQSIIKTGTFHTIWKKQKDGSWKYVWD
jgi:ketosteroid isomerase-like protein